MKKVLIVNPFVSQKYLAAQFKGRIDLTALFTCDMSSLDSYSAEDIAVFEKAIWINECDIEVNLPYLRELGFEYILNGSEESTPIFDLLANMLTPDYANNIESSSCRFDKLMMQEAMRNAQLPHISTKKVDASSLLDNPDLLAEFNYPVFFKPQQGYGSVGAFKAENATDILRNLANSPLRQCEYVVQDYIEGEEYVVDTFSVDGAHYVASVQRYKKENIGGKPVYRYCEVLRNEEEWKLFEDFANKMLDALSLRNGFAHSEIMYSPRTGMKLIELNNRISGCKGAFNACAQEIGLKSQTDLLCDFLEGTELFSSMPDKHDYGTTVTVFKMGGGRVQPMDTSGLTTLRNIFWCKKSGELLSEKQEYNLLDAVACLVCVGEYDEVHRDIKTIFSREQAGVLV